MKCLLIFIFLLGLSSAGRGGLAFDADVVQETAKASEQAHKVVFRFKVVGEKPITIKEVQLTCGCLSAAADKTTYAPRESGTITAFMTLGSFEGEVTKSIYVHSDDPTGPRRQLQMKITIPKLMEISPDVTTWQVGDAPVPKTISVKVLYEKPIEVTGVISTREKFTAEVKEITKGREYQIVLSPETTAEPVLGALRLTTTCDVPRYKNRLVFFNVVRPSAATPGRRAPPSAAARGTATANVPPVTTPRPATPPPVASQPPAAVPPLLVPRNRLK